jgi:predicted RNA binding protein YcfA (HicA-like mRNA interferase family)
MPSLPRISGEECVAALAKIGFVQVRQRGSHIVLRRDQPRATITVPAHNELATGTLRAIIRQADLTVEEFRALL